MITGIHHVGLSVHNLDAMIAFYIRSHGYTLHYRFDVPDNETTRAMLRLDDASARGAFLTGSLGGIELFEFSAGRDEELPNREIYAAGIRHICLQTGISDTLFENLIASGATAHARPAGLGTGNSYVYIRDPEGNLLELEGTPWAPPDATQPWFAHAAFVTPDIERLTGFYEMLTGTSIHQQGLFGPDRKFDVVAGIEGIRFQGAWLRLANAELEFWQYHNPETVAVSPRCAAQVGWNHICFESDDIDADHTRLAAAGVELQCEPKIFGEARIFFGRDPDGNIFEVLQPGPTAGVTVASMLADRQGRIIDAARTAFRTGMVSGNVAGLSA